MGNYNSEYATYYQNILQQKRKYSAHTNKDEGNRFGKVIIRQLVGALVLFVIILTCKSFSTPATEAVYTFCKNTINKEYDYDATLNKIKSFSFADVQDKIVDEIETIRCKVFNDETFKETINKKFLPPMEGKVISKYGDSIILKNGKNDKNRGINIKANESAEVLSAYDGKVTKCGNDNKYGKYVLIDHGEGIETLYSNLNAVLVKEGDEIKSKEAIGLIKNDENNSDAELHFELKYMGQNKDPMEYLSLLRRNFR